MPNSAWFKRRSQLRGGSGPALTKSLRRDFQHEVFAPTATAAFHSQTVAAGMLLQQRPTRRVLSSRPPSCCVTRPRAWSRTSILKRFASLLAGG